ncbi:type II toxin-antitoxin system PemK/MazF family toxin [Demequina sp.]|uniref:type II toxin-antitoxin system PemK/MazF family toxin n=1 Tax=Demequina sp. TaxID=2050685 RepID=UPI003D0C24AF
MISPSEIWLVDFGDPHPSEPAYTRPAVIIGPPTGFGERFPLVFVAPLTTRAQENSLHVELEPTPASGLDAVSYVQTEGLRSIGKSRLVHRMGEVDPVAMREIRVVLARLLAIDRRSL